MTFGALELETRRKILFAKDWVTVRSIGEDIVFVGELQKDPDTEQTRELQQFFADQIPPHKHVSLIIDFTRLTPLSLFIQIIRAKWLPGQKNKNVNKTAFIVKTFLSLSFATKAIKYLTGLQQARIFDDTATAIQWCRQ